MGIGRRLILNTMLGAGVAASLPGCGKSPEEEAKASTPPAHPHLRPKDRKILTFFGIKERPINSAALFEALKDFDKLHPEIDVYYDGLVGRPYYAALKKRVLSNNLDDVFIVNPSAAHFLKEKGRLADITDLIPLRAFQDLTLPQFYPRGERIFHVPMCLSTYGLFCNNTLLAKDGFAYPQKLSDFKTICDFYVKKGITPIIANNLSSIPSLVMVKSLFPLYRNPLTLKEKKEVLRNEPKMLADTFHPGFQMVEGFLKNGWINGAEALATRESFGDAAEFQKGERPFMLSQTWCAVELKEKAKNKNFSFCVAAFPIFESGSVLAIHTDLHLAVNGFSPNLEDAKHLLSFLLRPQNIYRYIVSQVAINPLKNSKLPASPILVPEINCFRAGRYVFDIDYELQPNLFEILNSACLLLLKGASPDEARKALLEKLGTPRA